MPQQFLIECSYGWGKLFQLYHDHLEIDGTTYALDDLSSLQPTYYRFMGIPSARLVLRFKRQKVTLRGIAAVEELRQAVGILNTRCIPHSLAPRIVPMRHKHEEDGPVTERTVRVHGLIKQEERVQAADTVPIETPRIPRSPKDHRTLRRVSVERPPGEQRFEEEELARRLKEEPLPVLPVPLCLLPGEYAHYTAAATLCEEPSADVALRIYQARDQGILILTGRRLIYIGRNGQIVLDYARLLHISRLQGAVAVLAEHWDRSELFELQRPLECTMYLEYLKTMHGKGAIHCAPRGRL